MQHHFTRECFVGEDPGNTSVFRAYRYATDYQAFDGRDMEAGDVIELNSWLNWCSMSEVEEESQSGGRRRTGGC